MTNVALDGPDGVTCEPMLDWSELITIVDPYRNDPFEAVEIKEPATSAFRIAVLADGRVLLVGGREGATATASEIFDPKTAEFSKSGLCHSRHAMLGCEALADGRVLLVPGYGPEGDRGPELWNPADGSWSRVDAPPRKYYVPAMVLLQDGRVLVLDGTYDTEQRTAEIFDPKSGSWSKTGAAPLADTTTTLTVLRDGRVLMVGRGGELGLNQIGTSVAAVYEPGRNAWNEIKPPQDVRCSHTATLLEDGRVLVAGGAFFKPSAEIYDPGAGTWTATQDMGTDRSYHAATRLSDGRVLVIGGAFPMPSPPDLPIGEVFDPKSGSWTPAAKAAGELGMRVRACTLGDGRVLVLNGARAVLLRAKSK